jgi:hypothetical protein
VQEGYVTEFQNGELFVLGRPPQPPVGKKPRPERPGRPAPERQTPPGGEMVSAIADGGKPSEEVAGETPDESEDVVAAETEGPVGMPVAEPVTEDAVASAHALEPEPEPERERESESEPESEFGEPPAAENPAGQDDSSRIETAVSHTA